MNAPRVIFFGSTSDSVLVLEKLPRVFAVVTQPARPVGRKQIVMPTQVATWAKAHGLPVLFFASDSKKSWVYEDEARVIDTLQPFKADLLVSACYGQKIPWELISKTRCGGLNVHPSLLPRWRGADPVPWAILSGDRQTGVSIVTLSKEFDEGQIIAQKKISITHTDMSDPLRTKLFTIGADLLVEVLPGFIAKPIHSPFSILHSPSSYARRLTRDDGFETWDTIQKAFDDPEEAKRIDRKFRAFHPWPGLWTKIGEKRLKILALHIDQESIVLDEVQWEGKKPIPYSTLLTASHKSVH